MKKILLKRKNLNNPQIKAYAKAVEKGRRSQHVIPADKGWAVRRSDAAKASKLFETQKEAIVYGKFIAKQKKSELFIHKRDGLIRERISPKS